MNIPHELPRLATPAMPAWGARCSHCLHAGASTIPGVVHCHAYAGERFADLDRQCDAYRARVPA